MVVYHPPVLDELFHIRGRSVLRSVARETDLLRKRPVLPQQLNVVQQAIATIRPMRHIRANLQLMSAKPLFGRKLKCWVCFELIGSSGPGVKEIAVPAFGIDQHVRWSLTVGIAIKPCVAQSNLKQRARVETMNVRDAGRDAFLVVIRGRGLRYERRDISKLCAHWKNIDVRA